MRSITKRRWFLPSLGLALAIVAALAIYAFAVAGGQRPMTGQVTLSSGPNGEACGFDGYVIVLEGSATLSHVGDTAVVASNCSRGSLETGPAVLFDGSATFTAADGSTISVEYQGHQLAPVQGMTEFTVSQTVTSGTGRFANAAGEWTVAGSVDLNTPDGELHGDIDGWITY